ncbi:MAG: alpha/beta hydrolase-fold protein [Terracidiphilus sp.]
MRNHPDRWPFVIVMPQCPQTAHWTDPDMLELAMASLDQESTEFHGDPSRTYLTGLSLGGYGAWELARLHPHRWAAIAIAASGVFWSYEPDRWQLASTLPAEYARAVGRTPVWLFHGGLDPVVVASAKRTDVRRLQSGRRRHSPLDLPGVLRMIAGRAPSTSRSCRTGSWHITFPPLLRSWLNAS